MATFKTFVDGDNVLATGGKVRRYRGDIPRLSPAALLSAGQVVARMNRMAKTLPVEAPWDAPKAAAWDAESVRSWVTSARVPTRLARELVEATVRACLTADPSEISLLAWLFLVRASGGIESLMNIAGGYQDSQFEGGVGQIPDAMAANLGDAVVREAPVTARRVVMALPRALATGIRFEPALPGDHVALLHAVPAGCEVKTVVLYEDPFWRAEGVSGATVATDDLIEVTLDTTQPGFGPGVIATYSAGPRARALWSLSAAERRAAVAKMLTTRLGPRAASPLEVMERNWSEERWTRGCSCAHFPTGVLTQYGRLLREPVGRVHWAGTETATTSFGAMDGAVRSGERVCEEILAAG